MRKNLIVSIIAIIFMICLVGCSKSEGEQTITRTEIFMGTPISLTLYQGGSQEILDKAFDRISDIEDLVSINKEGTELDKLNKNAGISPVKLSDTSYEIIEKGLEYSKLSQGGYDVTIGPLVKLWNIGMDNAKVPTQDEIDEVIKLVNYSNVKLDNSNKEVFLTEEGMILDLGSIAKGYVADEIVNLLKEEGVTQGIIDLGGNIYALGKKEEDKDWNIGIQNPFSDRGSVVGTIEISNKSIVTTGVYERFIEEDGVKYHHILNPNTGYPYETNIAGVSIVSDYSIDGDALSTLVFTKGLEEGIEFVESLDNIDAIFITNNKEVYLTDGIKDNFNIMNEEFKINN